MRIYSKINFKITIKAAKIMNFFNLLDKLETNHTEEKQCSHKPKTKFSSNIF